MKQEIKFRAAYDKRHPDPKQNFGIHGADMLWLLTGKHGAVQFLVYTGWQLPHIEDTKVLPADIGYHSKKPMYEGQEPMSEKCDVLGGCRCYYDGSGLVADEVFRKLVTHGSDAVWSHLKEYYKDRFGELK